jgi:hypothetical protein
MYYYRMTFRSVVSRIVAENYLKREVACWSLESDLRQITVCVLICFTETELAEICERTRAESLELVGKH